MPSSNSNPYRAIATNLYRQDGKIKSFEEQLHDYAYDEMPSGSMFVVAESSKDAGIEECVDLPIVMKQSIVQKVTVAHDLTLAELKNLPVWLKDYPLALESLSDINSIVLIADAKDVHGNDILIALHLEKEYQNLELNEIASIYGKKNLAYLIENTFAAGKNVYVNERTGNWLQLAGLPLPELVANYLSNEIIALNRGNINAKETKTHVSPGLSNDNEGLGYDLSSMAGDVRDAVGRNDGERGVEAPDRRGDAR